VVIARYCIDIAIDIAIAITIDITLCTPRAQTHATKPPDHNQQSTINNHARLSENHRPP